MAFIALHKETSNRIDITTIDNPHDTLKSGDCLCQLCNEPLIVKAGLIISPHFAHYAKCTSDYQTHPESRNHRDGKVIVSNRLKEIYSEYINKPMIELEVKIPEVKRIADILITFPMGWRIAHEIQLSPITTKVLEERTNDYANAGIDTVWWLGEKADTATNRAWCIQNFGGCYLISFYNGQPSDKIIHTATR